MNSGSSGQGRMAFFKAYLFLISFLVVSGWTLSLFRQLNWLGIVAIPGSLLAIFHFRRWAGNEIREDILVPLSYWPLILIGSLSVIAALSYPPTMLDSLTYRLPQILIWLKEGHVHHVQAAEDRLNYMPQVWGIAAIPLYKLAGYRLFWFWSFISWIALYLLSYDWSLEKTGDVRKSRLLAFLASGSTYAVLQAGSTATDLFGAVFVLIAVRFAVAFERTRDWWNIHWAILSIGLATGSKPHYTVLGLPFVLWFLFARSKPWKTVDWISASALLPVWLLCSSAPAFYLNYQTYGSLGGPGQDKSMKGTSPGWSLLANATMVTWQSVQPPVNPLAIVYNPKLKMLTAESTLKRHVPRFHLATPPVAIVDAAGLGLVACLLFATGVVLVIRRDRAVFRSWRGWTLWGGIFGTLIAMSQFAPLGAGRSYSGFLYLSLPLVLAGLTLLSPRALKIALWATFLSALCAVTMNPSRRLWPAESIHNWLTKSGRLPAVAHIMKPYLTFPERATTGVEIMEAIPDAVSTVAVLVGDDRPLWPMFSVSPERRLILVPLNASPEELDQKSAEYVVTGGGVRELYPRLMGYLETSGRYELLMSRFYTSRLERGAEEWRLYRRKGTETPP